MKKLTFLIALCFAMATTVSYAHVEKSTPVKELVQLHAISTNAP